jgi:hypothetical protein
MSSQTRLQPETAHVTCHDCQDVVSSIRDMEILFEDACRAASSIE